MILSSLLSSSNYIIVNKDLIRLLGLHEAIILGELCSEYSYWEREKQLKNGEYFYSTRKNIEKNTGINAHYQRTAINNLEKKGILITKRMGIPCKKYYKIDENVVFQYLQKAKITDNPPVVHEVNDKESTEQTPNNSNDEIQVDETMNINNNNINNKKNHTQASPSLDEEKKQYAPYITMTEKEHNDLVQAYGDEKTKILINELNLYKQSTGKEYENDYATILRWVVNRFEEQEKIKRKSISEKTKSSLSIRNFEFNQSQNSESDSSDKYKYLYDN